MIYLILQHSWKRAVRSVLWHRTLATNIFIGVVLSLLGLNLLSIGLYVDRLLEQLSPGSDPIILFNGALLYYLAIDLVLRSLLQRVPGLLVRPYLQLPVPRRHIVHLLLVSSALSLFNLLPLLILVPFALKLIFPVYSFFPTLAWLVSILCLVLCNSFLHLYLAKAQLVKAKSVFLFALVMAVLIALERLHVFSLSRISSLFFQEIIRVPVAALAPVLLLALVYRLNFDLLARHLYIDKLSRSRSARTLHARGLSHLQRYGPVGDFISLELKLLLRNKRSKATLLLAGAMMVVALLFYSTISEELEFYPAPASTPVSEISSGQYSPDEYNVTFRVLSGVLPARAHVYITGDHAKLGPWRPSHVPLVSLPDRSWQVTIPFEKGTKLRYIFTLGSWKTECAKADGKKPDVQTLYVRADTTIVYANPNWKTPHRDIPVDIMVIYMGALLIGILMLAYGQFLFSWESSYFDLLISRPLDYRKYIAAKYLILLSLGIVLYLLVTPLVFISPEIFYMNSSLLLYNVGVNSHVLLLWGTLTRKRVDLSASLYSTQGKGSSQFLVILPTVLPPVLIYLPFALNGHQDLGFVFLAALGVAGLLLYSPLLGSVVTLLFRNKYKMAVGFREI